MSAARPVEHDERTQALAQKACAAAYFFLMMALYVDVAVRAFARHEAAWDLLALNLGTSAVCAIYLLRQGAGSRKGALYGAIFGAVGGIIFAVVLSVIKAM